MKHYNFAIIGQRSSGKTTLSERILFETKNISRMGSTTDGSCVTDYHRTEVERGFSIQLSLFNFERNGSSFDAIDTPGYSDFTGEARCGIAAADNIIYVADSTENLKAHGFRLLLETRKRTTPVVVFINKLDSERSEFDKCYAALKEANDRVVLTQIPLGDKFSAVSHLLETDEFPEEVREKALRMKKDLTENIVEHDDQLMERYFDGETLTAETLRNALKNDITVGAIVPTYIGSSLTGVGVSELLDAIKRWFIPSDQISFKVGDEKIMPGNNLVTSVFKTFNDPKAGRTNCIRIWSGTLKSDSTYYNSTKNSNERFGSIYKLQGKKTTPADTAKTGEFVAVNKLKHTLTGNTITDGAKVQIEPPYIPPALISYKISGKNKEDTEKLGGYLSKILEEDGSLRYKNSETGEFVLSGMGKLHIDVTVEKLKKRYGIEVVIEPPSIPYRETIKKEVTAQGKYKKQSGGHGQYGDCKIIISPTGKWEDGVVFSDEIVGGAIPRQYISSVQKGVTDALKKGKIGGYPVIGIKVRLVDGTYHSVDSSDFAFQMAGQLAIKEALNNADSVLLEPIDDVELTGRSDDVGAIIGDINSRRGEIIDMKHQALKGFQQIEARMPESELLEYAPALRSITAGFGRFTTKFEKYKEVPANIVTELLSSQQ